MVDDTDSKLERVVRGFAEAMEPLTRKTLEKVLRP